MVGRKADLRSSGGDIFECRQCGAVVSYPFNETEANDVEQSSMTLERLD
jgi:hypothetical protein